MARTFVVFLLILALTAFAGVSKKRFDISAPQSEVPVLEDTIHGVGSDVSPSQSKVNIGLWNRFADVQKGLREQITEKISAMQNGDSQVIFGFLLICFIYGLLHALGPGHGKSIVIGYFLARKGSWRQGLGLGAGITFAHTLSAVALLFILYAILKAAVFPSFELGREGIEKVSYVMILLTGILLIGIGVKDFINRKNNQETLPSGFNATKKEIIAVAAVTGIVPCPAVALIVLFCLLHSMVALSLIASVAICLGMTLTNMLFGLMAVAMRKGLEKGMERSRNMAVYMHVFASIAGGIIVLASGLLLLSNTLSGRC